MSGRVPIVDDAAAIAARVREIRAERLAAIAGCECPPDGAGGQTHRPNCPLGPEAAMPQMELARGAMQRARARMRQAGVPIREDAAADDKAARGRVLS